MNQTNEIVSNSGIGAWYVGEGRCEFTVWAPLLTDVAVKIVMPNERTLPMAKNADGYWRISAEGLSPGNLYVYRLENEWDRSDPASFYQPQGVHGPSMIVNHSSFTWTDKDWSGISLSEMIMYELHVGTFTSEGTFDAATEKLDYLVDLGINAIELMPVTQFPGERNWGYDGTYPFAVQNSYGSPDGLKQLVNTCHQKGIAVILDVVYNHLGPEGNYLHDFGPYFTDKYLTPWGTAINYDGAYSDEVRNYFIENALHWLRNYHIDALRLDAVHGIYDFSSRHILEKLSYVVHREALSSGKRRYLIAESDLNNVRVITPFDHGGYGLDAQWNEDYHHSLHSLLTGERNGYYMDFGAMAQFGTAWREGFVFSGQFSSYRKRSHGNSSKDLPAEQFVVFSQNHDQVGNRAFGDRLSRTLSFEGLKLAAAAVILSPYIPLIFMGEEYGETAPFQYFVSHSDQDLIEAVRQGRRSEFSSFGWGDNLPDPQDEATFLKSKLRYEVRTEGNHALLLSFYSKLIYLRKRMPSLSCGGKGRDKALTYEREKLLSVIRWLGDDMTLCVLNFDQKAHDVTVVLPVGNWELLVDSSSEQWGGKGGNAALYLTASDSPSTVSIEPLSAILYRRSGT